LTYDLELDSVKVNHRAKKVTGHFVQKLHGHTAHRQTDRQTDTHTHTHTGPIALTGPLRWSVTTGMVTVT